MKPSTISFIFLNLASIISTAAFLSSSPKNINNQFIAKKKTAHHPLGMSPAGGSIDSSSGNSSSNSSSSGSKSTSNIIQMEGAKKLISNAIAIGAPAYNAGNIKECARVYKDAAIDISSSLMLPSALKIGLDKAIQTEYGDDNEEAWGFRKQFDGIMEYQFPFMPTNENTEPLTLEKFTDRMIPSQPVIVNDNVMGGMSEGQWEAATHTFKGNTSLANNGGFSSLRWRMSNIQNWSYAKGIYLKVKHSNPEQHTFRLILKDTTCEQVRGANFKNIFSNPTQSDKPILFPFDSFDQIEQMGRPLKGPLFNRGAVIELGLMAIKPSVVGEFELKIVEWGLYTSTL
eukprot:scaffold2034_cov270-Chaetoceros_neogracile.AAC.8